MHTKRLPTILVFFAAMFVLGRSAAGDGDGVRSRPAPADVTEITVGAGAGILHLERAPDGWDVTGKVGAPADSARVEKLLRALLESPAEENPAEGEADGALGPTGLENGGGLPVRLTTGAGDYEVLVGLHPKNDYGRTHVGFPDGERLIGSDVRGVLGLWKNSSEAVPESAAWFDKNVLSFDPGAAVRIEATYPDHRVLFEKNAEGVWSAGDYVPGGEWSEEALRTWLEDLSAFRVSGALGAGVMSWEGRKGHEIRITLEDGTEKAVWAVANPSGSGMLAVSSRRPGHVFLLPDWRFRRYFQRLSSLFPKAAPRFDLSAIRFMDIRRDGETVKLAARPDGWQAPASPYPVRREPAARLARLLSSWRPEDYAAPDFKVVRPLLAGPMVEVILDDGSVHQYRLAGRHPIFPWRYVILDGVTALSTTDAQATAMFPGLADVLDLGRVIPVERSGLLREVRIEEADGKPLLLLRRRGDGFWEGATESGGMTLGLVESGLVVDNMLAWPAGGFYHSDPQGEMPPVMYRIVATDRDGARHGVQLLEPSGRDIPAILQGRRAHYLDRKLFYNWLSDVRGVVGRIRTHRENLGSAAPDEAPEGIEPPVEIPLSTPSAAMDGDLVEPDSGEDEDAGEAGEAGTGDEVERFVDRFVGS